MDILSLFVVFLIIVAGYFAIETGAIANAYIAKYKRVGRLKQRDREKEQGEQSQRKDPIGK